MATTHEPKIEIGRQECFNWLGYSTFDPPFHTPGLGLFFKGLNIAVSPANAISNQGNSFTWELWFYLFNPSVDQYIVCTMEDLAPSLFSKRLCLSVASSAYVLEINYNAPGSSAAATTKNIGSAVGGWNFFILKIYDDVANPGKHVVNATVVKSDGTNATIQEDNQGPYQNSATYMTVFGGLLSYNGGVIEGSKYFTGGLHYLRVTHQRVYDYELYVAYYKGRETYKIYDLFL